MCIHAAKYYLAACTLSHTLLNHIHWWIMTLQLKSLAVPTITVLPFVMFVASSIPGRISCHYCTTLHCNYNIKAISISLPVAVWIAQSTIIGCWLTTIVEVLEKRYKLDWRELCLPHWTPWILRYVAMTCRATDDHNFTIFIAITKKIALFWKGTCVPLCWRIEAMKTLCLKEVIYFSAKDVPHFNRWVTSAPNGTTIWRIFLTLEVCWILLCCYFCNNNIIIIKYSN